MPTELRVHRSQKDIAATAEEPAATGMTETSALSEQVDDESFFSAVAAVTAAFGDTSRRQIYACLKDRDGVTAAEIAEQFKLHVNVARHHLDKLAAGGYVDVTLEHALTGAGRPSKRYRRSSRAATLNVAPRPDELVVNLLVRALSLIDPATAMEMAEEVGEAYGKSLAAVMAPGDGQRSLHAAIMDVAMWQTLQRKLEFITAALKGDRSVRNMEDVSSEIDAYRDAKAIASGDPTLMIKADLEAKVAKEIRLANATQDQQYMNRRLMDSYRARIERAGRLIPLMEQDLATLAPMEDGMFTLTVGDRDIPDRKDAAAALVAILRRMEADKSEADIVVGQYRGFPIRALGRRLRFDGKEGDYVLDLEMVKAGNRSGDLGWRGNTPGHKLIERMESEVYYLGSSLATERGSLESNRVQLQQLETAESKPYDRTKLDEMLAQLAEIDARLSRKEAA